MTDLLTILQGDVLERLRELPDNSVQCVVTSPPYWGLRDYGVDGQIGLEASPADFLAKMVRVFDEIRRVLNRDGTCWVNMGDSYAGGGNGGGGSFAKDGIRAAEPGSQKNVPLRKGSRGCIGTTKAKDKLLMPHRLAIALGDAGWYVRSDIVWAKPNPMPESCRDRPTTAHEYVFLLSKSPRYYYNADAIRTPPSEALLEQIAEGYEGEATKDYDGAGVQDPSSVKGRIIANRRKKLPAGWDTEKGSHGTIHREGRSDKQRGHSRRHEGFNARWDAMTKEEQQALGANARSVWTIPTKGYPGAHFATFPPELPRRCILAGTRPGDVVLDPFGGSGTTGEVALELGRKAILIELNPTYVNLIHQRLNAAQVGLAI